MMSRRINLLPEESELVQPLPLEEVEVLLLEKCYNEISKYCFNMIIEF